MVVEVEVVVVVPSGPYAVYIPPYPSSSSSSSARCCRGVVIPLCDLQRVRCHAAAAEGAAVAQGAGLQGPQVRRLVQRGNHDGAVVAVRTRRAGAEIGGQRGGRRAQDHRVAARVHPTPGGRVAGRATYRLAPNHGQRHALGQQVRPWTLRT